MAIIPNLAIHLQTMAEREKFGYNKETHLKPIWSTRPTEELYGLTTPEEHNPRHFQGLLQTIQADLALPK